jgi:hypothetical protein
MGKNMIFLRKIVIFHTKYPKTFRASLRWVFRVKNHDFTPKNHVFPILVGASRVRPAWIRPWFMSRCIGYNIM